MLDGLRRRSLRLGSPARRALGPLLAAGLTLAGLRVLGLHGALPLAALLAVLGAGLTALLRFDLLYTTFLFYLLFETVVGPVLPGPLPLVSKDLFYIVVVGVGLLVGAVLAGAPLRARHADPRVDEHGLTPAPGTAALLLFFLVTLLLALRGPTLLLGVLGLRAVSWLFMVALLLPLAYRSAAARRAALSILGVGLAAVAIIGIYEFFHWREVRTALELEEQRWTMGTLKAGSTVGSPGAFGALMGLGLLFLLARAVAGRVGRAGWLMGSVLAALWFAGLVLSFSRISQIAFVTAACLLLLRRPRLLLPGLGLILAAGLLANVLTDGFLWGNLVASVGRGEHADAIQSTIDRVDIARATLTQRVPQHPWLGYGLGTAGAPTRERVEDAPFGYLFLDNYYLLMLLEGGVLGLCAYLALLAVLLALAWRTGRGGDVGRPGTLGDAACVRAAGAGLVFYAIIGTASTVHEIPVVNASFWWCAGWVLWGAQLMAGRRPRALPAPAPVA
jgi:hypothetical protein